MLSAGMLTDLALSTAVRRRGLEAGSPPPRRAAIDISRMILVKIFPRLASSAPFLCLMECHLECPDIGFSWFYGTERKAALETRLGRKAYHGAAAPYNAGRWQRPASPSSAAKRCSCSSPALS